jgi:hypothetical protein
LEAAGADEAPVTLDGEAAGGRRAGSRREVDQQRADRLERVDRPARQLAQRWLGDDGEPGLGVVLAERAKMAGARDEHRER